VTAADLDTAGLTVHRAAATEPLVERLAAHLRDHPPPDPFTTVEVAVQSRGMERWLSHQLAERLGSDGAGICANVTFPFPGKVVASAVAVAVGPAPEQDPWAPERLVWPLLATLPELLSRPELGRVARYLGLTTEEPGSEAGTVIDRRGWGLARRVADLLDRYALHRPSMVRAWNAGQDLDPEGRPLPDTLRWQPLLWRALKERIPLGDPVTRLDDAIARLQGERPLAAPELLPRRVTLFGISALPPRHVDLLAELGRHVPVDLHVLTPSPAHWERGEGSERASPVHPLLVSCGRLVNDLGLVLDGVDHRDAPVEDPVTTRGEDTGPRRLLHVLQADLHADVDRGAPGEAARASAPHPIDPDDTSVQIHGCHGPARQVEVLRDVLLGLLDDDPTLEPRDVLVMTPDVEDYAPLVDAVFAEAGGGAPALPVRTADRSLRGTNLVAEVLLDLLSLAEGRVSASDVLDLLGAGPVAARFGFSTEDLARLGRWVVESGIRWGVDERHRAAAGQPAERVHTWRFGLDRLLLGVTMADEEDRVVDDVTPYDDVEGDDVELLGRMADAVGLTFDLLARLRDPRGLDGWTRALTAAVDGLIDLDDEDRWRVHEVRGALEELSDRARGTGAATQPVLDLGAMRVLLEEAVDAPRGAAGYETGAVTVCAMVPMRSIPHRVVCLLGVDDDVFPRAAGEAGFDLTATSRHVGDRDRRDEDRLLFLEALLAARQHLVLTYTGHDVRSNEPRAPAVPVTELLDVLERSAVTPDGGSVADRLTTQHPLQPFSPRNFGVDVRGRPAPVHSYDAANLEAARVLQRAEPRARPFVADRLTPGQAPELTTVGIDELARFLAHPIRALFEQRLGLRLREEVLALEDTEPLQLGGLDGYRVGTELLSARLEGDDPERWRRALLARGTVPTGVFGRHEIAGVAETVDALLEQAADDLAEPATDVPIDLELDGHRLVGTVGGLRGGVRTVLQYARVKPSQQLDLWVRHLALAAAGHTGISSRLHGRRKSGPGATCIPLPPLADDTDDAQSDARRRLSLLLAHYRDGYERPLPLFPTASAASAAKARADVEAGHARGLHAARSCWEGDERWAFGDRDDAYVVQAYGEDADLDEIDAATDFARLALEVYQPLLERGGRP
jgi:exodeoxyribonuclease V gamma subunit